jgi:hypothetical protein
VAFKKEKKKSDRGACCMSQAENASNTTGRFKYKFKQSARNTEFWLFDSKYTVNTFHLQISKEAYWKQSKVLLKSKKEKES